MYTNDLETFYNSCPGPVQEVLNFGGAYTKVNEALHWITGDPEAVAAMGQQYADLGQEISRLSTTFQQSGTQISRWQGEARTAFDGKITDYGDKIQQLSQSVTSTQELLNSAAESCVECANAIIDIVKMFIEFLIGTLAFALATAIISFGATVAAWVAGNLANGLRMLAQVSQLTAKVAQFLAKLAQVLEKIANVLRKIAQLLMKLAKFIRSSSAFAQRKGLAAGQKAALMAVARGTATKVALSKVYNPLTPGFDMPSGVGEGRDAVGHGSAANDAANNAETAGVAPPTF